MHTLMNMYIPQYAYIYRHKHTSICLHTQSDVTLPFQVKSVFSLWQSRAQEYIDCENKEVSPRIALVPGVIIWLQWPPLQLFSEMMLWASTTCIFSCQWHHRSLYGWSVIFREPVYDSCDVLNVYSNDSFLTIRLLGYNWRVSLGAWDGCKWSWTDHMISTLTREPQLHCASPEISVTSGMVLNNLKILMTCHDNVISVWLHRGGNPDSTLFLSVSVTVLN